MPFIDEAVITAVSYSDFLEQTLPFSMKHIKRIVVVTSDQDSDDRTRDLCRKLGIKCLSTGLFHRKGARFAKGAAINRGLDHLSKRGWVLHMDADIVLPEQTSDMLQRIDLDKSCIYGIDRVACPNGPAFKKFLESGEPQYRWHCLLETPPNFPLMGRYIHESDGWVPLGYFQLWHGTSGRSSRDMRYPEDGNEATHTDVQHSLHWDGHKRRLIPEIIAIHLDSCSAPLGANWCGRVTPSFSLDEVKSNKGVKSYYSPENDRLSNPNHSSP